MPMLVLTLAACDLQSLLPPLSLDGLEVRDLTYDRLDADLAFLVDDERDPENVDDLQYAMVVEDAEVAAGDPSDTEVDGNVILAPVSVAIDALPGWADLVGRDDVVPFTVTSRYVYLSNGVNLDFTLEAAGEMPAPHAPDLDPLAIVAGDATLRLAVVNRDPTGIIVHVRDVSARIGGEERAAGAPPPLGLPGDGAGELVVPLTAADPAWGDATDVAFEADIEVETSFGPIPWPVARTFEQVSIRP